MTHSKLSHKSKTFLEDLRIYLFSSAKNSEEIDDIVDQLEVHLLEAEQNGKTIEKIIGDSPKDYMNQLSHEMSLDYKAWAKFVPIILFGSFSFKIVGDSLSGALAYSILELIGFFTIGIIFLLGVSATFKFISGKNLSNGKQVTVLSLVPLLTMGLFFSLIYLNRVIDPPLIHFGQLGSIIAVIITMIFLIAASWWAKTAVLLVIITLLYLPPFLLSFTSMQEVTQLTIGVFVSYIGIGIYLFITFKRLKKTNKL
ncbi:hypothetical protein CR194_19040 [Salipaludibacillus keqinensis]|uniref:HAAS transmembrane region domain-containing protein n=1 Tax=Salipaludibacillus keqinensis TaxID=2045207 RepID=A0A323T5K0_9BACI|nr:hypothetical protein [Salipaludibacillus keqinensis]PYZ91718.1 hypothetical protein CR194_19040 [Salipaludibacillus keqinensis]